MTSLRAPHLPHCQMYAFYAILLVSVISRLPLHTLKHLPHFQMYIFYAVLLVSVISRLPLNQMRPGGGSKGPGRRHLQGGGVTGKGDGGGEEAAVTFADVAGVDEAKEELQEVVVSGFCGLTLLLAMNRVTGFPFRPLLIVTPLSFPPCH